ncbi:zona pellucida sperm-binding protein 3-like [Anoplopoma fimbria]|uniref:zona pellucida sperm-binding protein 3-like n=1 Tax=Anoplopoma fimbria TaxID=229290 RepID=UPI0023EB2077|nr:zona pellucida sperm-binding protein 3-like [Anoplopoma fimbria]
MGEIEIFLCLILGHYITAQSVIKNQDATFFHDVPGFIDGIVPLPFERNFDLPSHGPAFHMLSELPPIPFVPRVEVFCDESKITILVDKRSSNGFLLTGEEIQFGDGCYSNRELPNQFVFTYSLDECGTTPVMQNGFVRFTNSLYLNLKTTPTTWWPAPPTVHISCLPKRSYPNFFDSMTFPENGKTFNIDAMNPSWTSTADSNIYTRGQSVNLQVSAKTMPERQQLFIQSCFVSASPEPHTRPKQPVIMNKGCTAPLGSPHAVVQFVASGRADVVNLVLNTSYLISELYIHCSVLISDQGVNFGSKSCNYNLIQSRWEDLSGNVEVCKCCTSKCKGLQIKNLPEGAKAMVSTGPFVIVEKPIEPRLSESQETSSAPVAEAMQSDRAVTEATIVSGTSVSRPRQAVVVVSQDPVARLTFWLPGQVRDTGHSEKINSEDILTFKLQASDIRSTEIQPSSTDQEPLLNMPTNMVIDQSANELGSDFNYLTLVDGLAIPISHFGRSGIFDTEALQDDDIPSTADMNVLNQNDFNKMREGLAVTPQEESNDAQPTVLSKLQFSKGMDGWDTKKTGAQKERAALNFPGLVEEDGQSRIIASLI